MDDGKAPMATQNWSQFFQRQEVQAQSNSDRSGVDKIPGGATDEPAVVLSKQQLQQKNLVRTISKNDFLILYKKGFEK